MSENPINEQLQRAIRAARRGAKEPAIQGLREVLKADPQNEEAWLWLARVMDDPEQKRKCLTRVLVLNPENRWAAEQLEALKSAPTSTPAPQDQPQSAPAAPTLPPSISGGEVSLKLLTCPNCGGSVNLKGGEATRTVVCNYCQSILDLGAEQAEVVGSINKEIRPAQPIELGMEATFNDIRCQVVGWTRYMGWDDEDRWQWDEWLLATERGSFLWLSYDAEDGFLLQRKVTPTAAFNPRTAGSIPVPGGNAIVRERSQAQLIAMNGELTWRGQIGEQFNYLEAERGIHRYSVEYRLDEIELLEGKAISWAQVWKAFGREDLVKKPVITPTEKSNYYRQLAAFCGILAGVVLIFGGVTSALGRPILDKWVNVSLGGAAATLGPINIKEANRPYQIKASTNGLPTNSWTVVDIGITSPDDLDFDLFASEFWDEAGTEDGEYWHENSLSGEYIFVPEDPGEYFLEVAMDETQVQTAQVHVQVRGAVWAVHYFWIFAAVCGFLALLFTWMGMSSDTRESIVEQITDAFDN